MGKTVEELLGANAMEFLSHVSTKPWSDYKESDYSLEQWHNACLIHQHTGSVPTSKNQCKLPVKTPDGVLNKNGVTAAAAALAGARSPMNITTAQKGEAARKLASLYTQLNMTPSPKLIEMKALHSDMDVVEDVLAHHGVKGMKWGVRKSGSSGGGGGGGASGTTRRVNPDHQAIQDLRKKHVSELSNADLKKFQERINMEQKFRQMNPRAIDKGHNQIKYIMTFVATGIAIHKALNSETGKAAMARGAKFLNSVAGKEVVKKAAVAAEAVA